LHSERVKIESAKSVDTDKPWLNLPTERYHNGHVEIKNVRFDNGNLPTQSWHNGNVGIRNICSTDIKYPSPLHSDHCHLSLQVDLHSAINLVVVMFCVATVGPIIGLRRGFKEVLNQHLDFQHAVIVVSSQWMHSKTLLSHYIPS